MSAETAPVELSPTSPTHTLDPPPLQSAPPSSISLSSSFSVVSLTPQPASPPAAPGAPNTDGHNNNADEQLFAQLEVDLDALERYFDMLQHDEISKLNHELKLSLSSCDSEEGGGGGEARERLIQKHQNELAILEKQIEKQRNKSRISLLFPSGDEVSPPPGSSSGLLSSTVDSMAHAMNATAHAVLPWFKQPIAAVVNTTVDAVQSTFHQANQASLRDLDSNSIYHSSSRANAAAARTARAPNPWATHTAAAARRKLPGAPGSATARIPGTIKARGAPPALAPSSFPNAHSPPALLFNQRSPSAASGADMPVSASAIVEEALHASQAKLPSASPSNALLPNAPSSDVYEKEHAPSIDSDSSLLKQAPTLAVMTPPAAAGSTSTSSPALGSTLFVTPSKAENPKIRSPIVDELESDFALELRACDIEWSPTKSPSAGIGLPFVSPGCAPTTLNYDTLPVSPFIVETHSPIPAAPPKNPFSASRMQPGPVRAVDISGFSHEDAASERKTMELEAVNQAAAAAAAALEARKLHALSPVVTAISSEDVHNFSFATSPASSHAHTAASAESSPAVNPLLQAMQPVPRARTTSTAPKKSILFQQLMDAPILDISALRQHAWTGVPRAIRGQVWKLLMGYLPVNSARREAILSTRREEYRNNIELYYSIQDSNRTDAEHEILKQIRQDVPRTSPGVAFFKIPMIQNSLERLLYIWALRHPASGYVQGINDLVTPFYVVFTQQLKSVDVLSITQSAVEHDVNEALNGLTQSQLIDIEADGFWCLSLLLDGIQENYTFAQPGIQILVFKLRELVARIDGDLVRHFDSHGVQFLHFAFRWMNCLLMREIPLPLVLRLWDAYLSEPDGFRQFHLYVCAAFLLKWANQLKSYDFQELVLFLQKLPTENWKQQDIEFVLSQAFLFKTWFHGSNHLTSS